MPLTDALVTLRVAYGFSAALDLQTVVANYDRPRTLTLAAGTGAVADTADRGWSDQRTIAASGNDDLDLAGVLTDPVGAAITFARIRLLYIEADAANTNNLLVGPGAATNPWNTWISGTTPTVTVRPGGLLLLAARDATGYTVTAGTGDILRITNSAGGTSVTYNIAIVGSST